MADDFTHFACVLDVGSSANVAAALAILEDMAAALACDDGLTLGFVAEGALTQPSALWLRDDGGYGEPEHVIAFALRCAEAFGLTGRWGFCWALTCSRPREDGFGGGPQVLDLGRRKSLAWTDCSQWLASQLAGRAAPSPG
jgi:hypothetical protein